jgi:AraC-like DNA-binding protein
MIVKLRRRERLCARRPMQISRIRCGSKIGGIERMHAFFRGHSFTPHRHDTYAVGVTSAGIQSFNYRGAARHSLPGQVFVLHPDEPHDGRAGDEQGFGYRIAYVDPALVREVAATNTLPFMPEPVSTDARLRRAVIDIVAEESSPMDELATAGRLVALVDALVHAARGTASGTKLVDTKALRLVREMLQSRFDANISTRELEVLSGLSRWQLARQFRKAFGVSPHRYHVLRRLDRARNLLGRGHSLAEVAQGSGFADQAHFSRQFRSAFGLSPGQWRTLAAGTSRAQPGSARQHQP